MSIKEFALALADTAQDVDNENNSIDNDATIDSTVDKSIATDIDNTDIDTTVDTSTDDEVTWSKVLGVDEKLLNLDEEGNIKGIVTTINGQDEVVDLPALIAGFQNNKVNTQKAQAIAVEKQQFEQIRTQAAQEYVQRLSTVETLTKYLAEKIVGDAKNVDWDKLRAENPGEYAARVQDFNLKQQELQQILQLADQERIQLQNETMGQQTERSKAFLNEQATLLIHNNPEWKNPEKMAAAFSEMSQFATTTYGFSMEDFNSVADARVFSLLQDAMKYRKGVNVAQQKVTTPAPKFQKSSGKGSATQSKLQLLTQKAKTSKGADKRAAQTDAIAELLLGGKL